MLLKDLVIAVAGLALMAAVWAGWQIFDSSRAPNPVPAALGGGVVCTMDAKLCPDGSYVSRHGPNCEFAPCPAASLDEGAPIMNPDFQPQ